MTAGDRLVLLPYRFTLFSNKVTVENIGAEFYYLIDLHYSQTGLYCQMVGRGFYYLIDLHYSQTSIASDEKALSFTTL